jgi:hypothetical protein
MYNLLKFSLKYFFEINHKGIKELKIKKVSEIGITYGLGNIENAGT